MRVSVIFTLALSFISESTTIYAQNVAQIRAVQRINQLRERHSASPLAWRDEIAGFATSWAEYLRATNQFEHSTARYGENLAQVHYNGNLTASLLTAVHLWYAEMTLYNFTQPRFSHITGHATALIWAQSKHIGLGYAIKNKSVIVCANFDPPGNVAGAFSSNVRPLKSTSRDL